MLYLPCPRYSFHDRFLDLFIVENLVDLRFFDIEVLPGLCPL
jgi:hypothetical protein